MGEAAGPDPLLAGVLFDLDGTLADTEGLWRHAYGRLAAGHGVELEPGWWARIVGRDLGDAAVALLGDVADTSAARERCIAQVTDAAIEVVGHGAERRLPNDRQGAPTGAVTWRPGARQLLCELRRADVPTALVTATPRRLLEVVIDHLGIEVDVTVAGDEVQQPKPDPEGYRRAAGLLGIDVRDAVVVEDSPTGAAAGAASGARVLAVPSATPLPVTVVGTVVESLAAVTPEELAALPRR